MDWQPRTGKRKRGRQRRRWRDDIRVRPTLDDDSLNEVELNISRQNKKELRLNYKIDS